MKKKEKLVTGLIGAFIVTYLVLSHFFYLGDYMVYLVFIFPLVSVLVLMQHLIQGYQTQSWPMVRGKIIKSEVIRQEIKNNHDKFSWDILYQYQVFHKSYTGQHIAYKPGKSKNSKYANEQTCHQLVKAYPVDKEVPVYYNPKHHHRAVLERGTNKSGILIPLFMLLFSCGLIYLFWQKGTFHF